MDDLRYVLRTLWRSPAFSAIVILTLALGIGANAAMFGIIDRLLLRGPEHVVAPDEVKRLYASYVDGAGKRKTESLWGYVTYAILRDHARTLDGVAAYAAGTYTIGTGAQAERTEGRLVTREFFPLLGVRPALGRFFTEEEDRPTFGQKVVVLDHGLWERSFGGDSSIVGKTVLVFGEPYTVVGVAPAGFTGAELRRVGIWFPMSLSRITPDWPTTWNAQWLQIIVRAKPGVSLATASAEATQLHRRFYAGSRPTMRGADVDYRPISFTPSGHEPQESAVSRWLSAVSLIVLVIACANTTNLLLARATRRRREVAVRIALGVSHGRLLRLLMSEGFILALIGCLAGLMIAYWGGGLIRATLLPDVAWLSSPMNGAVLGAAFALAIVTGTLVGLAPAMQARDLDLTNSLKSGSPQSGSSKSATRGLLLLVQAALSFVLLVGAGLFVRSLHRVTSLDLGFQPERAITASISWPRATRSPHEAEVESARRRNVYISAVERLRATPGVEQAAIAVGTPFGNAYGVSLWVPGKDSIPDLGGGGPYISAVTGGYFEAAGMRLVRGRAFTREDAAGTERVAIINEPMARALWPGENAVGKCLQIFSRELPCTRVVGVVAEARRFALREPPAMQYYVPFGQELSIGGSVIVVRPTGDPDAFVPTLRRVLLDVDPGLLSTRIEPMQDAIDPLTRSWRVGAMLFTIFGALALLIAAIGLYSVIAYIVAQRTQEFGVRMALGATSDRIVWLVLRDGMTAAGAGLVVGLTIALLAGRYVESLLFETSPYDLVVIAVAGIVLVTSALIACYVPARRASRIDAAIALRAE